MEGKARNALLFSFFALTISLSAGFYAPKLFETQILETRSLPQPPALSWPESEEALSEGDSFPSTTLSVPLHHVDALAFNKTPEELLHLRLRRDSIRVTSLTSIAEEVSYVENTQVGQPGPRPGFSSSVISGLTQGSGEYFTRLGVGTPPKNVYLVLDTGSDVIWIQCTPCQRCYSQTDPVFDPTKSQSFANIPCSSPLCQRLDSAGCNRNNQCIYQVSYGDGSFTLGEFSTETLTFRGGRIDRVAIGCGHDNEGLFVGAAGLLGLGRGSLSFPTQTGPQFNRKFSYCLVDRTSASKPSSVVFGEPAVSRTALFTPLLTNPKLNTFYYVELLGISVGGAPVPGISASLFKLDPAGSGGVIIDSGTSVTRLTRPAYIALRDAFRIGSSSLKRAPEFSLFDTCYDLSGKTAVKVPTVVLHFRGADVALPASNYLIPVDKSGTFCFAFAGTTGGLSIIGNIQQQGFRVIYDLDGSRVGFAPRGCA